MSFNPATIPKSPFLTPGAVPGIPIRICTALDDTPKMAVIAFDWSLYGVSNTASQIGVDIDLAAMGQRPPIKSIRGVYIDNTDCDAAIFIHFPDTQQVITCAAFSTVWQPALTNGLQFSVFGKGFITGDLSQTRVFILNVPINPGVDNELSLTYPQFRASPQINRGNNIYSAGWASPAIGDQWNQGKIAAAGLVQNVGASITLFGSPYSQGGVITVTDLEIYYRNINAAGNALRVTVTIASNGVSGTYWNTDYWLNLGAVFPSAQLTSRNALQHKLNAAETWTFSVVPPTGNVGAGDGGVFFFNIGFSYQGQSAAAAAGVISTLTNAHTGTKSINAATPAGGFKFLSGVNALINAATFIKGSVTGEGNYHCELWTDSGGFPLFQVGSDSATVFIAGAGNEAIEFAFPTPPAIANGSTYWLVIVREGASGNVAFFCYTGVDAFATGRAATIPAITAGLNMSANEKWSIAIDYTLA